MSVNLDVEGDQLPLPETTEFDETFPGDAVAEVPVPLGDEEAEKLKEAGKLEKAEKLQTAEEADAERYALRYRRQTSVEEVKLSKANKTIERLKKQVMTKEAETERVMAEMRDEMEREREEFEQTMTGYHLKIRLCRTKLISR